MNNTLQTPDDYFTDLSFTLREKDNNTEEATLFLSFWFEAKSMNLSAYDYAAKGYSHVFSSEGGTVEEFLSKVEADYQVSLPAEFRVLTEDYTAILPQIHGVDVDLGEGHDCETCGWSSDKLEAYYFPAIEGKVRETLRVRHEFGCFGGAVVEGDFVDVKQEAVTYLLRCSGESKTAAESVEEFTDFIQNKL